MTFITIEEPPLTPFEFLGEDTVKQNAIKSFNETIQNINSSGHMLGEKLSRLHSNPIFMPNLEQRGLEIFIVIIACILLHFMILSILKRNKPGSKEIEYWRESTQLLNMVVNFYLGMLGIYYHVFLRTSADAESLEHTANQWENFAIFGVGQAGYQIWSIAVGIYRIKEPLTMIMHHISVVCVALISVVFTNGFRYYTAFFYGVAEISSVPLAMMNMFKNNPSLVQKYPTWNIIVKLTFAILFLSVRVIFWAPIMSTFLRLSYSLSSTCPTMLCAFYLRLFMFCATFLSLLQLFWAWKIIKGLLLMTGLIKKKSKLEKGMPSLKEE